MLPVIIPVPVVVAGPTAAAEATQEHTFAAAEMTSTPVRGPQAESTQPWAMVWMALDCEVLHWQAKSVVPQLTAEAALLMQEY